MATSKTSLSPGVSIVIVSFNERERLQATLSSIPLNINNIEVILVVPICDINAIEIANSLGFSSIRLVHDLGSGVYHAMNLGIENASFSHVLFLNTGDLIMGASQLNDCLLEINQSVGKSLILPVVARWSDAIDKSNPDLFKFISGSQNNYVSHQGVLFSKLFVSEKGKFDQKYKVAADFKQLCLLYRFGDFEHRDIKLVAIEYPEYSARFNKRGRFESLAISIIYLRGRIRFNALKSRLISEIRSINNKFS